MIITKTNRLVLSGMLAVVGVLLPYFTSHIFGLPGTVLLPMHLPVFLIGLLCGPGYGALCGAFIPVLSCVLTGMPPLYPMLPIMTGELVTYGLVSGLIYRKTNRTYPAMLLAMVCGRTVYGLIFAALTALSGGALRALSVSAAFVQGLPGIAVQLIIIPLLVRAVLPERQPSSHEKVPTPSGLAEAMVRIQEGHATCVVMRGGVTVREASGNGIKPVLQLLENEPEILAGAVVVDKVIGKAAAMLLVLAGVQYVYGELMSAAGRDYLQKHGIEFSYGRCIDVISNRSGSGICPLEKSVLEVEDPKEGYLLLKKVISQLKQVV